MTPILTLCYRFTAGVFVTWLVSQSVTGPEQVSARYVRQFIAELVGRGLQDTTVHDYARAIKTLLLFWHAEKYIPEVIKFEMRKLAKKRLPVLTAEQLRTVAAARYPRQSTGIIPGGFWFAP